VKQVLAAIVTAILAASSTEGCNAPGDKTPTGKQPVPAVFLLMKLESSPPGVYATITINARDHSGLPSVDLENGEIYPTTHPHRTPYEHIITHPATATVTYSMEAFAGGDPGTILGCSFWLDGVKLQEIGTPHVTEIQEGSLSTLVYCEYTRYPVTT
jgi:hypothetical protein